MTIQTLQSIGITFSPEFEALCQRRRDLGAVVPVDEEDEMALSIMWDALADEYENTGYDVNGGMCRKKAQHWQAVALSHGWEPRE